MGTISHKPTPRFRLGLMSPAGGITLTIAASTVCWIALGEGAHLLGMF